MRTREKGTRLSISDDGSQGPKKVGKKNRKKSEEGKKNLPNDAAASLPVQFHRKSAARLTLSETRWMYASDSRPVVATCAVATCEAPTCLAAKPAPDFCAERRRKSSPPTESSGVTDWK